MLIQATAKLRDELNLKECESKERPALFSWHANLLKINKRKTVVLVNDACAYTVVLYGLDKDKFTNFAEHVNVGIKNAFERDGIKESLIYKYLNEFKNVTFQKTKNKKYVARMNFAAKEAEFHSRYFSENSIYQPQASVGISRRRFREIDTEERFHPDYRLHRELAEYFGEKDIIKTKAAVLKVELELGEYKVWRKVIVPLNYSFRELHKIIQKLFNWQDYHLHEYFVYSEEKDDSKWFNHSEYHRDGYRVILNLTMNQNYLEYNMYEMNYQDQDFKLAVENEVKLKDVITAKIKYIYDYGDYWQHYIETEEIIEDYKSNKPTLLAGEGTAPPEDVGGVDGFSKFLQILSNPNHEEYEFMQEWAKSQRFKEYDSEKIKAEFKSYYYLIY